MTFDFAKVPRQKEASFVFFPGKLSGTLRHFLREQHITGWEIDNAYRLLSRLPDIGLTIPGDLRLYPDAPRVEKDVSCLVSYMEPKAAKAEIDKIYFSKERYRLLAEESKRAAAEREYAAAFAHDPSPLASAPWRNNTS